MAIRCWSSFERSFAGWDAIQDACRLHRLCRGADLGAGAGKGRCGSGRSRRLGGRRRGRRAVAAGCRRGAAADGAGRPDVASAGRREHAATGLAHAANSKELSSNRRARDFTDAAAQRDAVDLAGRLQHHRRDPVLRRPRRPGAVRHRARDRAGRSRDAGWPSAAWWPGAAGHAVGRTPGRCRRSAPCAGPSMRSFPPCDVNGGAATAALLQRLLREQLGSHREEAARWREAGRTAQSVVARRRCRPMPAPALDRLLELHREPRCRWRSRSCRRSATPALAERLGRQPGVDLLQHGYAHLNHAAPGEKKAELGPSGRPWSCWASSAPAGMALERLFGAGALPVLVPPWNRIAPGPGAHLAGNRLSRSLDLRHPRGRVHPVARILQVNTHVDLIDWKGAAASPAKRRCLARLVAALAHAAYRVGRAGRASQSPSCDGRRGVGFPKVNVGKSTDNARHPHPAGA